LNPPDRECHQFPGYLSELLVYDRVLSASEINEVERYLAAKLASGYEPTPD
jgi:hypothetical protein